MEYTKKEGTQGEWLKAKDLVNGTKAKLTTEVKPQESEFGMQDVAKISIQGDPVIKNVRVNKPTINALIDAFGIESNNWTDKVLTIQTERILVAGKRVTALYLVPEGYELEEDDGGYLVITKKGTTLKPPSSLEKKEEPEAKSNYPTEDINPADIPF